MCEHPRPDNSLVYHGNPANGQTTTSGDSTPEVRVLGEPPRRFVLCAAVNDADEADDGDVADDTEEDEDDAGSAEGDLDGEVEDPADVRDEGDAAPIGVLALVLMDEAEAGSGASGVYEPVMWGLEDQDGAFVYAYDPVAGYRRQGFFGSAERARALFARLGPLRLIYV